MLVTAGWGREGGRKVEVRPIHKQHQYLKPGGEEGLGNAD